MPGLWATVGWRPLDVQALRPQWSMDECEAFLSRHAAFIQTAMHDAGMDAIDDCIELEDCLDENQIT